jgi:hypothetical protein
MINLTKNISYQSNLKNYFIISALTKKIEKSIDNLKNEIDLYVNEDGQKTVIIDFLVNSHHGIYIPQFFCQELAIRKCSSPDSENYHDEILELESQLSTDINNLFADILKTDYFLYFSYSENGDYCLFMTEIENPEKIDFSRVLPEMLEYFTDCKTELISNSFPGGYSINYITEDGCIFCPSCAIKELQDNWSVKIFSKGLINWQDYDMHCELCSKQLIPEY